MSVPAGGHAADQPEHFELSSENRAKAEKIIAKYPAGRQASAVIPLLDIAQRQCGGWLPQAAMDHVAAVLSMAPMRVYEVASFYTMFNLQPMGRHHVQVCTTTPCMLRDSDSVLSACRRKLGIEPGQTTPDGMFTLTEVECLGACVNAPMMQIGDLYYEDLDAGSTEKILDALARGETPKAGSQTGRATSAPQSGPTTLTTIKG